jgi:hypothetical protein
MTKATSFNLSRSLSFLVVVVAGHLFAWCAFAASPGMIAPELAEKLSAIFPMGTMPEQVRALCGDPELVNQFSPSIVVWRYVSGNDYVLFSFENERLAGFKKLPRPAAAERKLEVEAPSVTPSSLPRTAAKEVERTTWKTFYGERGAAFGARIGSARATVFEALLSYGLGSDEMKCETDSSHIETCTVEPNSIAWQRLDPSGQKSSMFLLMFEDDRLRAAMHVISYRDEATTTEAQAEIRTALAAAFQKPAQRLGFWRRKISSMLLPMASVAEAARWEHESVMSLVVRGKLDGPDGELPTLLVIVAEKDAA